MTSGDGGLRADVLAKLLLVQSTASQLPDDTAILAFVCRGLEGVPGVARARHCQVSSAALAPGPTVQHFPVKLGHHHHGALVLELADAAQFVSYSPHISNLAFVVAVVLEERRQRKLSETHRSELERRVEERTRTLSEEIDERRRAQAALAAEKRELAVTLRSIGDAVIATDAQGRVTRMNLVAEALTGWPEADAAGQPLASVFRIFNEHTRATVTSPVALVLREGKVVGLANHTLLAARDGTERPIADSGAPIRGEDGAISGVVLVFRDQTEEHAAHRVLEESEARFRTVFQAAPSGIALAESLTGRFRLVNPMFAHIVGRTEEALCATDRTSITHPDDVAADLAQMALLNAGKIAGFRMEKRYLRPDGAVVWADVTVAPVKAGQGGAPLILCLVEDITEHKRVEAERQQMEEQLRVSQKMEAVGQLAGGIAHDFNNLLGVILNYTEFAQDSLPEGAPAREELAEVRKAAERATGLTRQLLAFSRKQLLQPTRLDLNQVVTEIANMLRRLIGEDIELEQALGANLGLVMADRGQLEQVIMNLAINARDAMPGGGKLTIATANVELSEVDVTRHAGLKPGPHVVLTVSDSGRGMDAATLGRAFEPFFTTKERGRGTGLGLSTVYGIVRQSDGDVSGQSEPGRGATFRIHFPRASAGPAAETAAPGKAVRRFGSETILLVEDEASVRMLTRRILEGAGYTVLEGASGGEALVNAAAHQREIHLLLTDVVMPQMSGAELASRLGALRPDLKVLFMSGYTDDVTLRHGVLSGQTRLLAKPFTALDLTELVRETLDAAAKA